MDLAEGARCFVSRLIAAVVCLAILVGAGALLFTPDRAIASLAVSLAALRSESPDLLAQQAVVVGAIAFIALVLELWPARTGQGFRAVVDGGTVEYPSAMVVKVLETELASVEGIHGARVNVQGGGRRVDVLVRLATRPDDDAQAVATRAAGSVRDKIGTLGLEMRQLRLAIQPISDRSPAPKGRATVTA